MILLTEYGGGGVDPSNSGCTSLRRTGGLQVKGPKCLKTDNWPVARDPLIH